MKNLHQSYFTLIFILFTALFVNGQGCSDAGFCTLDGFKPHSTDSISTKSNQFKIGFSFGSADNSISTFGNYIEYNRKINNRLSLDTKLTSLAQSGNDISTFGLSDLYLNANYRLNEKAIATVGTKIPLSDGNEKENGAALPMDYQASLGTFDLILGFGYKINRLQLVAAYQQPLTDNDNAFLTVASSDFISTNKFKRSGDVLLRASYPFDLGEKFKLTPSLLPIYHLSNDKYTDALNVEREIDGSQGLTLNLNAYLDYEIKKNNYLQLNIGSPLIIRDTRPDGLTRGFIANLEYRIKF